ncbi:MAG: hypothetical protein P4L53_06500 [Candidatus Obscuribacterales bacterium]|nr:hypothetical protein [Candidatus Obscuribacterales bacterium]
MVRRFSARLGAIATVFVVAIVTVAGISQLLRSSSDNKSTTLQQVLDLTQLPWQLRLFPGGVDTSGKPLVSGDRAVEILRDDQTGVDSRYQTNKDKSTIDAHLQPDGRHQAESQSFYPTASDGDGRHPQALTKYQGAEEKVVDQDVRRVNGKRLQLTHVSADGAKSIIDYAEDGLTVVGETLFDPPPACCGEGPLLKSQQRWLADAQHSLVYSDITNKDGKRTKTKFDGDHQILWTMICQERQCYPSGTTVTGYYAGTHKPRFESKSDYYVDEAKYYRDNGTLWYDLKIMPSSNDITFYDATGTKPVLEQNFFRHDEIGPDKAIKMTANSVYEPYEIFEFDADGNPSNNFTLMGGKVGNVDVRNITISGVFYKEISFYFDRDTGQFNWGVLFPNGLDSRISVDKSNFTPPPLPRPSPDELKLSIPFTDDDLPVPPPQQHYP